MRDVSQPLSVTIAGATARCGINRTKLYELVGSGKLEAVKCGTRTLILVRSLDAYVASLPHAEMREPRQLRGTQHRAAA